VGALQNSLGGESSSEVMRTERAPVGTAKKICRKCQTLAGRKGLLGRLLITSLARGEVGRRTGINSNGIRRFDDRDRETTKRETNIKDIKRGKGAVEGPQPPLVFHS